MPIFDLRPASLLLAAASTTAVTAAIIAVVAVGALMAALPAIRNRQYRRAVEHDPAEGRTSHDIDFRIRPRDGHLQYLEVGLDPGETIIAQRGALLYAREGITRQTRLVSDPRHSRVSGIFGAFRRKIAGEAMWLWHFTNTADTGLRIVGLASPRMGQITPVDLAKTGGELIAERSAFFAAAAGTRIGLSLRRQLRAGFFGGEGFVLQRLTGDGYVFLHAHGTVFEIKLEGDTVLVDTGCIVAMETTVEYSARLTGSLASMAFGGEGLFLAALSGRGRVWLQSQHAPRPQRRSNTAAATKQHTNRKQRSR